MGEGFTTKRIFVGGIPRTVNEDEFKDFFSQFGEVKNHQIIRHNSTGVSRGFGFLQLHADQAVLDGLFGNKLYFAGSQVEIRKGLPPKKKRSGFGGARTRLRRLVGTLAFNSKPGISGMWSTQVPEEILHLVLKRLCMRDYLQFPRACCSWRQAVCTARASQCYPPSEIPWLVAYGLHFLNMSKWKFEVLNYKKQLRELYVFRYYIGPSYQGSIDGWLIELKPRDEKMQLRNPISRRRVELPFPYPSPLPLPLSDHEYGFRKVSASSTPTSPHCFVVILSKLGQLFFCRPSDESWTTLVDENIFGAIEILDQRIYAATNKKLMVFDLNMQRSLVMLHPEPYRLRLHDIVEGGIAYYLAKDSTSKELFMIFIEASCDRRTNENLRLFKLMDLKNSRYEWEEVFDIGARILFISTKSSVFVTVDEYTDLTYGPPAAETKVAQSCIVFASDDKAECRYRDVDVFYLRNRTISHIDVFSVSRDLEEQTRIMPVWFIPCPW